MLFARQEFARFAQTFNAEGDTRINGTSTGRRSVKPNFTVDDAMLEAFKQQLIADHVKIDDAGFTENVDFTKAMIRFEVDVALFGVAEAWRHLIMVDPQAQAAIASFGEAQKLTELSKANRVKAH